MIRPSDYPILRAFLHRESRMYNWARTGENGRRAFVRRMFNTIVRSHPGEKGNYVRIKSLTNMGLEDSELKLSCHPWDGSSNFICLLPPSPRGGGIIFREGQEG